MMEKRKLTGKTVKQKVYAVYGLTKMQGRKDRGAPVYTSTNVRFRE